MISFQEKFRRSIKFRYDEYRMLPRATLFLFRANLVRVNSLGLGLLPSGTARHVVPVSNGDANGVLTQRV